MKNYSILGLFLFLYSQFSCADLITLNVTDMISFYTGKSYNNSVSLVIDNATPVTRLTDSVGEFDNAVQSGFGLVDGNRYDVSPSSVNTIEVMVLYVPRIYISGYMIDSVGNAKDFLLRVEAISGISIASLSFLNVGARASSETTFDVGDLRFIGGDFQISAVADMPEPTTLILFVVGFVVIAARRLKGT